MKQVTMGCMYLQNFKSCFPGTPYGLAEILFKFFYSGKIHGYRNGVAVTIGKGRGSQGLPVAFSRGKWFATLPWSVMACFAAGMCQLNTGNSTLGRNK